MSYLTRNLKSTITYWAKSTPDGFGGASWGSPTSIKGRWEDRSEQFVDAKGDEVKSEAIVYVNQDVAIGGYLYNGSSTASDPLSITGSGKPKEIKEFRKIPDLNGRRYERKCYL